MADVVELAAEVVELLERGEGAAVGARLSERVRGWPADVYVRDVWLPGLEELTGRPRRIAERTRVGRTTARIVIEGPQGQGVVTVQVDDAGRLDGLALEARAVEGIGTIVIACPRERRGELADVYRALLGRNRWRLPRLAFDEADSDHRSPRWPDPERPQQLHLDLFAPDPDAAGVAAVDAGAVLLRDAGRHRVYADPLGHPFCLYQDDARADPQGPPARLGRVVIDCPDPRGLASFYERLLAMPVRIEDAEDRVVIGAVDDPTPQLGFQRVSPYVAPRWPDPAFPAQMHMDMKFDDREAVERLAERLGATRLPPQGGSCPVYADPAGHPFCLCKPGE